MFSGIWIDSVSLVSSSGGRSLFYCLLSQNANLYLVIMMSAKHSSTSSKRQAVQVSRSVCSDHQLLFPIQKTMMTVSSMTKTILQMIARVLKHLESTVGWRKILT